MKGLVAMHYNLNRRQFIKISAEIGYETAVTVLKVNEAVAQAKRLDFELKEFHS